jgi:hypothetical protein
MKLQIASDLHHSLHDRRSDGRQNIQLHPDADLLVLAGNVCPLREIVQRYGAIGRPVVYVYGGHDLYGEDIEVAISKLSASVENSDVAFLERTEFIHSGVRILGCSLWTDYTLSPYSRDIAMREADRYVVDHRMIASRGKAFTARHAETEHSVAKAWLNERLTAPCEMRTVVVTHCGPSIRSVPENLRSSVYAATIASNLDHLIPRSNLWIHGHVADSFEYEVGRCRVVCNGKGYPWAAQEDRRAFNPHLLVSV